MDLIYNKILETLKKTGLPAFAVLDFDNTCIINDITEAALTYLATNNLFKDKNLVDEKFKNYSRAVFENYYKLIDENKIIEAYEFISKILSGFSVDEIEGLVKKVIKFEGENISETEIWGIKINKGLRPRKNVFELINFLKTNGVDVWIVSASLEILVKETIKYFGIEANVIGIRNALAGNKITQELQKPLSMFGEKIDCIKKFIDQNKKPIFGIGDSMNDLQMLEYCEVKAAIDRNNTLTKIAKQNSWFLVQNNIKDV